MRRLAVAVFMLVLSSVGWADGGTGFNIPVEYHKLKNGLKVVLSPDKTALRGCGGLL